jgi:phospholipid-translocating ATPase
MSRNTLMIKLAAAVEAIALCHNVTPLYDEEVAESSTNNDEYDQPAGDGDETESQIHQRQTISYQAASPDEVFYFTRT